MQFFQLPIPSRRSFSFLLKERKGERSPLRLTLENWPIVSIHREIFDSLWSSSHAIVRSPRSRQTKMAKCTKTKQFLDPFERQTETNPPLLNRTFPIPNLPLYLRVCYSFWNRFRLIRDLEKEEGEEARCLISCALTNGWFIAASRKAWLSVTTRKTTSYPPRTHTRVCGYARGDSRNRQSRNEKRLVVRTPPLIRLTRPIG